MNYWEYSEEILGVPTLEKFSHIEDKGCNPGLNKLRLEEKNLSAFSIVVVDEKENLRQRWGRGEDPNWPKKRNSCLVL